jgi:hypothetical protein
MSSIDPATAVPTVQYNYTVLDPAKSDGLNPQQYQVGNFTSNYWRWQLSGRVSF